MSLLRTVEASVTRVVEALVIATGAVTVVSLLVGVFYRYAVRHALSWTYEVALLCFTWTIFLAAALLVREGGHVRVELIKSIFPAPVVWLVDQVIWILIAATGAYMVWTGMLYTTFIVGEVSPAIGYPVWWRDASVPVGGVLIAVYALRRLQGLARYEQSMEEAKMEKEKIP